MSFKDDFNLFIGSMYGIFKGVKATEGLTPVSKNIQSLNHLAKDTNITALSWSDENEEEILIGLSNQVVKTYDTNSKVFCSSADTRITVEDGPSSEGNICGLSRFDEALVTATESGHVRVSRYQDDKCVNIYAKPISRMRHSPNFRNVIGTGGLNNDLKLWDLNTSKSIFEAKNVPHDWLQLQVKVWATDHAFLPNSENVVVGSKYGYVRLYDPKAQKRPVVNVNIPDQAVTCITSCSKERVVLCGLAKGNIVAVDMRMGKTAEHYTGFLGAVKDIACHPTEPYIVSVGLDRFLRVHHLTTKDCLLKEYLVSRMTCVLMRSNFTLKAPKSIAERKAKDSTSRNKLLSDGQSDNEESQQLDEIFESMEEVFDGPTNQSQQHKRCAAEMKTDTPPKKKKPLLLVNPFASKPKSVKTKPKSNVSNAVDKEFPSYENRFSKVTNQLKSGEDSDDDLMIISETVCNPSATSATTVGETEDSEKDEAEGESDEFDSEGESDELDSEGESDELDSEGESNELDSQDETDEDENEAISETDVAVEDHIPQEQTGDKNKAINSKNHKLVKSKFRKNKNGT